MDTVDFSAMIIVLHKRMEDGSAGALHVQASTGHASME